MDTPTGSDPRGAKLALGTNTFGWTTDEQQSHALINAFVDHGGRLVDTSDNYSSWVDGLRGGEAETIIGRWFERGGRRGALVLGTKVSQHPDYSGLDPANIRAAADASLRRLKTDYIDIYYAHYDDPTVPIEDTASAFDALVRDGKVRLIGLSNYSADRFRAWDDFAARENLTRPTVLQPHYSLVSRTTYEGDLADLAGELALDVVPYYSLASGFLTGKYRTLDEVRRAQRGELTAPFFSPEGLAVVDELRAVAAAHSVTPSAVALAWLLSKPHVAAPIASARDVDQLGELMRIRDLTLSRAELRRLDAVSGAVGVRDGSSVVQPAELPDSSESRA